MTTKYWFDKIEITEETNKPSRNKNDYIWRSLTRTADDEPLTNPNVARVSSRLT